MLDSTLLKESIKQLKDSGSAFLHPCYANELEERGFIKNRKSIHIRSLELKLKKR